LNDEELIKIGIHEGHECTLQYKSGVIVKGNLVTIRKTEGRNLILSFTNCSVTWYRKELFNPSWGRFDLAAGESVLSAFPGPADPNAFKLTYKVPAETTHKITHNAHDIKLFNLYQKVRDLRDSDIKLTEEHLPELSEIWDIIKLEYPSEWLIMLELLEFKSPDEGYHVIAKEVLEALNHLQNTNLSTTKLIKDGLELYNQAQVMQGIK
jgi:phenylalanine-4-hydroxylase